MKIRKMYIDYNSLVWIIIFFLLLKPSFITNYPSINRLFNMGQIISWGIVILLIIKKRKINKITLLIGLYELVILVSTIINNGDKYTQFVISMSGFCVTLFIDYMLSKNVLKCLNVILIVLEFWIYINFITVLKYPHGFYNLESWDIWQRGYWVFGHANSAIVFIIPAICVSILYSYCKNMEWKRFSRTWILITICIITLIKTWSVTSIIGLSIVMLILFYSIFNKNIFGISIKSGIIFNSIFFVLIVILRIQNYLSWLIEDIFNRSLTFTGRTIIWDNVLRKIDSKWFLGYGNIDTKILKQTISGSSPHNEYLNIVFQGGIILMFVFIYLMIFIGKKIDKNKSNKCAQIVLACIWSFLIQFQTETHLHRTSILILFALAGSINYIINYSKIHKI